MARLWSPQVKFSTWRRLWVALAEAERALGLAITEEQIDALRAQVETIDFAAADAYERRFRHDVMAHIHAFGDVAPVARPIIHLGATSCYVTDNTDLILIREGLHRVRDLLVGAIDALASFAAKWKDLPCLGYTHFQPAQLVTVGKRATLWCQELILDLGEVEHRLAELRFLGVKGTTGTQASFLALFEGDDAKVEALDRMVATAFGFKRTVSVCGQTYTRKIDSQVLGALAGIAESAHRFGMDLRLLAHERELEEPFEAEQIGSSAMAYKRNPMRAERLCSLARFLMALPAAASQTAATQWLERTLDDSAVRRLILPQGFLAADAISEPLRQHRCRTGGSSRGHWPARGGAVALHGHREPAHGGRSGRRRSPDSSRANSRALPRGRGSTQGRGKGERPDRSPARRSGVPTSRFRDGTRTRQVRWSVGASGRGVPADRGRADPDASSGHAEKPGRDPRLNTQSHGHRAGYREAGEVSKRATSGADGPYAIASIPRAAAARSASRSRPCAAFPSATHFARTICESGGPLPESIHLHGPVTSPLSRSLFPFQGLP